MCFEVVPPSDGPMAGRATIRALAKALVFLNGLAQCIRDFAGHFVLPCLTVSLHSTEGDSMEE